METQHGIPGSQDTEPVDPYLGVDMRLLNHLGESLTVAHKANPTSWSLNQVLSGTLVLFVEQFWVLAIHRGGGDVRFFQSENAAEMEGATSFSLDSQEGTPGAIDVRELSPDELDQTYIRFRAEHHGLIQNRANVVRTRTQRAREHNPELVELLGRILGVTLPQPAYESDISSEVSPQPQKYRSRTAKTTGYWKQTSDYSTWERWLNNGILESTLWNEPEQDLSAWPDSRQDFTRQAKSLENYADGAAHRLWMFVKGMQPGDRVLVHDNGEPVFGVGTVTSDYEYVDGRHQRRLDWTVTDSIPLRQGVIYDAVERQNLWGLTPISPQSYSMIAGALGMELPISESNGPKVMLNGRPTVAAISTRFARQNLTYTPTQIATFYTALQAKGFVVLSGISGTGKSKIAQGFVEMLPHPSEEAQPVNIDHESVIELTVKPYTRKYKRVVIPVGQLGTLPPMNPGDQMIVPLRLGDTTGTGRLVSQQHTGSSSVTYLFFRGRIAELVQELEPDLPLLLVPESRSDDEGLDAIHIFTDAAQLPGEVITSSNLESQNSLFLSVRPDWRDSTSLLGYYNPLTETYEWTEFLRFILRAADSYRQEDGLAWFVILDEMNLAHVEYYFADLLSIIESGRDEYGWSREPIRLTYPDGKTDNPPPHEIKLPPNLYIIGTVNMDETTHAFSPKVLDRAFTIELTEVDFSDYPPSPGASEPGIPEEERRALLTAFTRGGKFARIDKDEIRTVVDEHPELRDWLQRLNVELAKHQFQFGYRVFDEIAQFVHNAEENRMFEDPADAVPAWARAFDHAVYMKVLPKFNGSHARLHGPLTAVLAWARNPAGSQDAPEAQVDDDMEAPINTSPAVRLNRVATRAERMLELLDANGFVSFG